MVEQRKKVHGYMAILSTSKLKRWSTFPNRGHVPIRNDSAENMNLS